jgi:predicted enzyme related to lactoylglutathione lyase
VHLAGVPLKLAFQRARDYTVPDWPSGQPQQVHLDLTVDDLESASLRAVEVGARVLGPRVEEEDSFFQVHADPSGHPFCLCQNK